MVTLLPGWPVRFAITFLYSTTIRTDEERARRREWRGQVVDVLDTVPRQALVRWAPGSGAPRGLCGYLVSNLDALPPEHGA